MGGFLQGLEAILFNDRVQLNNCKSESPIDGQSMGCITK